MSFRTRILLALLAVGVAPVALLGLMSYEVNRQELIGTVSAGQAQAAAELARQFEAFVLNGVEHLETSARYLPLAGLSRDDTADALGIPFRQLPWLNVLVLLSERGEALAPPVFEASPHPDAAPREPIGPAELDAFARSVPLATVLASDVAIGPPYVSERTGVARVAVGVRIPGRPARVLAAELSLAMVGARLREIAGADGSALLVDAHGNVIARGGDGRALSAQERQLVERGTSSLSPEIRTVERADGRAWLAAFAPVGTLGWGVVLARPEAVALRAASRARAYTLFWAAAALAIAVAFGIALARGVSIPVARLSAAARAVDRGPVRRGGRRRAARRARRARVRVQPDGPRGEPPGRRDSRVGGRAEPAGRPEDGGAAPGAGPGRPLAEARRARLAGRRRRPRDQQPHDRDRRAGVRRPEERRPGLPRRPAARHRPRPGEARDADRGRPATAGRAPAPRRGGPVLPRDRSPRGGRGARAGRGPGRHLAAGGARGRDRAGAGRPGAGATAGGAPHQQRDRGDSRGGGDPGDRRRGRGRRAEALGVRHGARDPGGHARAHLRPVLHAQGAGRRRRPRPHPGQLHRRGAPREAAASTARRGAAARSPSSCRRSPRRYTSRE